MKGSGAEITQLKMRPLYGHAPLAIWNGRFWESLDRPSEELPLSPEAVRDLDRWQGLLQSTFDEVLRDSWSGFDTLEQLRAFRAEGKRVFKRIKRELGPSYKIVYDPKGDARVRTHEKPPKPKPRKRLGRDPRAGPSRAP